MLIIYIIGIKEMYVDTLGELYIFFGANYIYFLAELLI